MNNLLRMQVIMLMSVAQSPMAQHEQHRPGANDSHDYVTLGL